MKRRYQKPKQKCLTPKQWRSLRENAYYISLCITKANKLGATEIRNKLVQQLSDLVYHNPRLQKTNPQLQQLIDKVNGDIFPDDKKCQDHGI